MKACLKLIKRKDKEEETSFMKNGGLLLEELITFCNGKSNPIRNFSAEELRKATNNYDPRQRLLEAGDFEFYKGSLEDRLISVKVYPEERIVVIRDKALECIIKDIVIGSQMSVHKNVLKLLGCCLETKLPIIVYEFVGGENLFQCIRPIDRVSQPLPWKCRLRIAMGIANAIAYLHTAFSRPVVHRDIKSPTIILDEEKVARLIDFSLSISIPEGQLRAEDAVRGRMGIGDPEYCTTGHVTEKSDVFHFGVFLLVLLAGWMLDTQQSIYSESSLPGFLKPYDEQNRLIEIVDPALLEERIDEEQFLAFARLGLSCLCEIGEDRPGIIDAAKQLRRIYQSATPL
ncbi:serine/threonine-protein kinase ZRK3-like [Corylus avellana]|uniref:serine/threonine-protein kinase ZRK3-like n=1 Tax=Corylus avellana TaxID=13451 RepID=UPI00286C0A2F|nr:serine/threonine-protein kinase ZRK3-like [Corylus avellana]